MLLDYQAKAIITKTQRLGDADKIVRLYCRDNGPISAIAKSAFKINSKSGPKLQVLNICEFLLAKGKSMDIVKEVKLQKSFKHINSNYDTLTLACYFMDILDHIAVSDDAYEELFDLIEESLLGLESAAKDSKEVVFTLAVSILWDLIKLLGYKPELDTCHMSQKQRGQDQIPQYFDMNNGSIITKLVYDALTEEDPYLDSLVEFAPGVFPILEALDQGILRDFQPDFEIVFASLGFLNKHLEYCLHKEFKSWKLVSSLNQTLSI